MFVQLKKFINTRKKNNKMDFTLFKEALNEYQQNIRPIVDENEKFSCKHDLINENGIITCKTCGEEIQKTIQHDKEWRYYGATESSRNSDPNRVQIRKCEDRNIYKDVENMGFSERIISIANKIYCDGTKGDIFRGNSRKAIIFACVFEAYKLEGKPQPHEKLLRIFSLTRKMGLKGLKYVNLHSPRTSQIHTTYITPVNLIEDIMEQFSANEVQKNEVISIYNEIKNKSSKLNRSRPQSVSAGLTYYWICKKGMDVSLKEFARKTDLSDLTIHKIAKEVAHVLGSDFV